MNNMKNEPLAVTGIGLFTSVGKDKQSTFNSMLNGTSGVRKIERYNTHGMRTFIAAYIPAEEAGLAQNASQVDLMYKMSETVMTEAIAQSGISEQDIADALFVYAAPPIEPHWESRLKQHDRHRGLGVRWTLGGINEDIVKSGQPDASLLPHCLNSSNAVLLQHDFNIKRPPVVVNTACASGASAIQIAVDTIQMGYAKKAIVVAVDASATQEGLTRFSLLSAMSRKNEIPELASRPFDVDRDGFVMGEGAAALVIESTQESAIDRDVSGYILGCGDSTDIYHPTRSSPDGGPISDCMAKALIGTGLEIGDIDCINAHGTSTPENDEVESLGITKLFNEYADKIPVTANKSMLGHTLSAAGAIEVCISLLTLEHQVIPPTINLENQDPSIHLDIVSEPREMKMNTVLSNSLGFGGQNVSILLAKTKEI